MSDALRDKVEERVERILRAAEEGATTRAEDLTAIMAVAETALVLARREGWNLRAYQSENITEFPGAVDSGLEKFSLPTRTRQVLREEPVPGREGEFTVYRVEGGVLQAHSLQAPHWGTAYVSAEDFALMAHALDLHDTPYRTEEVSGDESNPWGDEEKWSCPSCYTKAGKPYPSSTCKLCPTCWANQGRK